jgi:uncharacterized phiE125 gp8 family phage protein
MSDFYELTTSAVETPVTLAETKDFMRVETTADDVLITALIGAAVNSGEAYTNRDFVEKTYTGFFSQLCITNQELKPFIQLRRAPFSSVTSVELSINDVFTTVSSDDYALKNTATYARILFDELSNGDDVPYPLKVVFVSGYGAAVDVPEDIKTALKQHVLFLYENRGDVMPDGMMPIPIEVQMLYNQRKIINTF